MRSAPEISGVSIVLLGNFNPAIFTPAWFALHGLLPEAVADNADLAVAHQHVTSFRADWLRLEVTLERFLVETEQAPHIRVYDLAVRVFKEHLHHTPLTAFGINHNVHFQVASQATRDELGRTLAPVEPWGDWGHRLGFDGEHGGMTSLRMSQLSPEDRPKGGRINIQVEPSNRIGSGRTGIYVGVNDHFAVDSTGPSTAGRLMDLFESEYDVSLSRSNQIIDHVMSLVKK